LRVYIAGPYTGDVAANVRAAIDAADAVLSLGHVPFVPHLTHFWHLIHPRPWAEWMALDSAWVEQCQAVLRLPGPSVGADIECALAERLRIPVFRTLGDLCVALS
jgi:hypothetical protein